MSNTPHIVIIGAGLIGLSTADALQAGGARASVIEAQAGPALGASFSNSGMIHPSQSWPWDKDDEDTAKAALELAERSSPLIESHCMRLGISLGTGCYQLFDTDIEMERLKARYARLGVKAENRTLLGRSALYFPGDGFGNAYNYTCALQADLARRGVQFHFGARDLQIKQAHGKIESVSFKDNTLMCDGIVVAAGMGSVDLLACVDIDVSLQGARGYALNFKKPDQVLPEAPVMDWGSRSALTVFDDHLRLSGTVNEDSPDRLQHIWNGIAPELIAALGEPISEWTGERPMSKAGRPFICPTEIKNLWLNTGHGHMGWTLCAGSGALMAEMVLADVQVPQFAL